MCRIPVVSRREEVAEGRTGLLAKAAAVRRGPPQPSAGAAAPRNRQVGIRWSGGGVDTADVRHRLIARRFAVDVE